MKRTGVFLCLALLAALPASAQLSRQDRKQAQAMLAGTLYFRIDAPCGLGRQPFGTYKFPLVEVSPTEVKTEGGQSGISGSLYNAQATYWGVGPNDTVSLDEIEWDEDTAEIEFEGVGATDGNDTVVKFVGLHSLDDFRKAVDLTFAHKPLQDEHDDWSPEVKKSIADRHLMNGMTKRQVFYVTGSPESTRTEEQKGQQVETWTMRQDKGMKVGFWTFSAGEKTGAPPVLKFVDGKLTDFAASGSQGLKLDS